MRILPVILGLLLLLNACSSGRDTGNETAVAPSRNAAHAIRPVYKVGRTYTIAGRSYTPRESFDSVEVGTASWYGPGFHHRTTANGEVYDQHAMTAAHRTLQMPSIVQVTNLDNGKSVIVRVNDRGPFIGDRIIDLSERAAKALDFREQGLARVRVAVLPEASRQVAAMVRARETVGTMDTLVAGLNQKPPPAVRGTQVAALKATPAPRGPNWFLQAAAFQDQGNANRARQQLGQVGPTHIVPHAKGDRTLYLVRLGPYDDRSKAQDVLRRMREVGFDGALLVESS